MRQAFQLLSAVIELRYSSEKRIGGLFRKKNPLDEYKTRITSILNDLHESITQSEQSSLVSKVIKEEAKEEEKSEHDDIENNGKSTQLAQTKKSLV